MTTHTNSQLSIHVADHPSQRLTDTIQPLLQKIQQHVLFYAIQSIRHLQIFSEIHVFAVYDFMCLIKALQRQLSCNDVLWLPPINYLGCRLLHEIILEEETDEMRDGEYCSHFDFYLTAMQQCGANTQVIKAFIQAIQAKQSFDAVLNIDGIPKPALDFMRVTFQLIDQPVHIIASAFAYGREQITEKMFTPILERLKRKDSHKVDLFMAYFQRHIDLDGGKHGALSQELVTHLCGNDSQKWQEAKKGAQLALESRLQLLDGIYARLCSEMGTIESVG